MNLIRFELRRMTPAIAVNIFITLLMIIPLVLIRGEADRLTLEKLLIIFLPLLWMAISCESVVTDREQLNLLTGMPVSLARIFWARFLMRVLPPVIAALVFWSFTGFPWENPGIEFMAVKIGGGILAVIGIIYLLAMSKFIDDFPVAKGSLVVIALFIQMGMMIPQWMQAGYLQFVSNCVLTFVIIIIFSWEIWQSVCLNRKLRWRIVLLFLLPWLLNLVISFVQFEPPETRHHLRQEIKR